MLSDVMEDYLKAVYTLQRENGAPVATSALADYLDVTPSTVTSMVGKLADRDLVHYEKYEGVELTDDGETVALEVLRHHRLLESFLAEGLDYDPAEVHDEADALEHHISEEFERRVAATLDDPAVDPHGDPIPGEELEPVDDDTTPLSAYGEGRRVVVARVSDRDSSTLDHLADAGIEPGVEVTITAVTPIDTYELAIDERAVTVPADVADTIRVRPVDDVPAGGGPSATPGTEVRRT
ncbi:MAG: metal-dependent transcriptional regulator [Halobacteriaceae archaeon]